MDNKMTRFDFEQQLMDCWGMVDDLKVLNEAMLETNLTTDQISNILVGLEQLYGLKFDKTFRTFEQLIRDKSI